MKIRVIYPRSKVKKKKKLKSSQLTLRHQLRPCLASRTTFSNFSEAQNSWNRAHRQSRLCPDSHHHLQRKTDSPLHGRRFHQVVGRWLIQFKYRETARLPIRPLRGRAARIRSSVTTAAPDLPGPTLELLHQEPSSLLNSQVIFYHKALAPRSLSEGCSFKGDTAPSSLRRKELPGLATHEACHPPGAPGSENPPGALSLSQAAWRPVWLHGSLSSRVAEANAGPPFRSHVLGLRGGAPESSLPPQHPSMHPGLPAKTTLSLGGPGPVAGAEARRGPSHSAQTGPSAAGRASPTSHLPCPPGRAGLRSQPEGSCRALCPPSPRTMSENPPASIPASSAWDPSDTQGSLLSSCFWHRV